MSAQGDLVLPDSPPNLDLEPSNFVDHEPIEISQEDSDEQIQQRLIKLKLEPYINCGDDPARDIDEQIRQRLIKLRLEPDNSNYDTTEDVDEQIRQRLTMLHIFSKVWALSGNSTSFSSKSEVRVETVHHTEGRKKL